MKSDLNILHLTPDFNYSDGRSYYVYLLLKYLKRRNHNVILCSNKSNSKDRLSDISIPFYKIKSLSEKYNFLKSVNIISKIAEENNIDLIHSHHRYYELIANAVRSKTKIKTVFTALSIVDKRYFVEYKSDRIIAVSNCVKEMLINKFKVKKNKIDLIANFTDTDELKTVNTLSTNDIIQNENKKQINVLSVGRLHRDKNYLTLLKAFSILKDMDIKLTIVGEGEEKTFLEEEISQKSINAEIISPQRDLNKYFYNADICVLSSVRDPLPGFMLQSGLFKKPFIGTSVDGISEVIKNRINGLLFERKNETELAGQIRLFIEDRTLAANCALNLNSLILSKYTEKTIVPEIEKLYRNL